MKLKAFILSSAVALSLLGVSYTTKADDLEDVENVEDFEDVDFPEDTTDDDDDLQEDLPVKRMTVSYKTTAGKTLRSSKTFSTTGEDIFAYGDSYAKYGNIKVGDVGYVKPVKGYLPYRLNKDYAYNQLPSKVTITYIKASTLAKKVQKSYMAQFNAYRKARHVRRLKASASLQKKANVRANELWKKTSHTRPNGKSYNKKNSGYAETMAVLPAYFLPEGTVELGLGARLVYSGSKISVAKTAQTAVKELMTVDKLHRQTSLNKWARYSAVSFSFKYNGAGRMAQLFKR